MTAPLVIAIDGPAGAGKSTVGRALAARLGLGYLDTGAMYRAMTFAAQRRGVPEGDLAEVAAMAPDVDIVLDEHGAVTVDGVDATTAIRGREVTEGVSQIGRGTDQTIALDFGDMAISRQHHAAIAYDPMSHQFHLGHGGKSNLVRLNGKPLLSTAVVGDGDEIQIGETTLVLKVLCTADFNWSSVDSEGDADDMAIA